MKQFTVVFPVAEQTGKNYILLGQQRPGKPLAGFLNGYGGKVEEGDGSVLECAERELFEELGIALESPVFIGTIVHEQKEVFFYLSQAEYKEYADTEEMLHNDWYDLEDNDYMSKMMPGDEEIIQHIRDNIEQYFESGVVSEFRIVKTGAEIDKATVELDKSIKLR